MAKLIGIAGRAGSGKSTCSDYLVGEHKFIKDAYARRLKQAVSLLFDVPLDTLHGDITVKSQVDPFWRMSYREIMQKFGTEACRAAFGPDFWEKVFWRGYEGIDFDKSAIEGLVIEDVRFPNEARAILERGGKVIEVVRPGCEPVPLRWWQQPLWGYSTEHSSERPLPRHLVSQIILNDGSVEQLCQVLNKLIT